MARVRAQYLDVEFSPVSIQYRPFNLSFQTVNQLIHFLLDSFLFDGDKIICGEKPLHKKKELLDFYLHISPRNSMLSLEFVFDK